MLTSYSALIYVNYPTQVLAKSCKMIPVLIMSTIMKMKLYPIKKYINVIIITAGISIFMHFSEGHKPHKGGKSLNDDSFYGYILLFISLASDGFTNGIQDLLRHNDNKPSSDEMMLYTNTFALIFVTIALLYSGEATPAILFCYKYYHVMLDLFLFCLCMSVGQIFIFICMSKFGNLFLSLITTSRKFFSITFSVIWFGNSLSSIQWAAVIIVFIALLFDVYDDVKH